VERAVQRTGYADFWQIRRRNAIPRETTNYVPIILAMTIMHKNAKDYGIDSIDPEPPVEYETLAVQANTHLGLVADAADRPVSEIRDLNPALLTSVAPARYEVHVPPGTRSQIVAAIDTIPVDKRASWRIHRVADGDTLESIARRYNTPVSAITAANNAADPEPGEVLIIPTASQIERARSAKRGVRPAVAARTNSQPKSRPGSARTNDKSGTAASVPKPVRHQRGTQTAALR